MLDVKGIFRKEEKTEEEYLRNENKELIMSLISYSGDDPAYSEVQKRIQTNLDIMERMRVLKTNRILATLIDPRVVGSIIATGGYLGGMHYGAVLESRGEAISHIWQKLGPKGPKIQ